MQTIDQQPKTSGDVEPNGQDKPMTFPSNLSSRRRRGLLDEDELPEKSHRLLWTIVAVILAVLIGAAVYSYRTVGAYLGRLGQVPAMHDQIDAAGRRIDAAEASMRGWTSQRDAWSQRLSGIESRIDGTLRAARKQAEDIVARSQRNMRTELDQRTASLQGRMDRLQTAQESRDTQVRRLEEQLNQAQAANSREVAQLREDIHQAREDDNAVVANLGHQLANVDQRSSQSTADLESVHRKIDRERTGFELALNHDRELAQGVNLNVSHTDVLHQRFDGWLWLLPDHKTISIHSRGVQQPLSFYSQGDERPRELVITRVTKYSVIGYILQPRQNATAPNGASGSDTAALAVRDFQATK